MRTILVTGCAGFIGFHVAKALLELGDLVVGVDNLSHYYDPSLKKARLAILKRVPGFSFVKGDVADIKRMERLFRKRSFDKVCHLAAQAGVRYSLEDPFTYEHANNKGTLTLLECCRHHGVKHFVYASSSSVYGSNRPPFKESDKVDSPISVYAATKRYNELLAKTYSYLFGINTTGLRFFTVYGPWGRPDMALFKFTKAILKSEPIEVYNNGKHSRDFTYVDDIVQGVIAAIDTEFRCEVFNLARGESVSLGAFIAALEKELGAKAKRINLPKQPGDVEATSADITKAKRLLGYSPSTSVKKGIKEFVEWYKEHHKVSR